MGRDGTLDDDQRRVDAEVARTACELRVALRREATRAVEQAVFSRDPAALAAAAATLHAEHEAVSRWLGLDVAADAAALRRERAETRAGVQRPPPSPVAAATAVAAAGLLREQIAVGRASRRRTSRSLGWARHDLVLERHVRMCERTLETLAALDAAHTPLARRVRGSREQALARLGRASSD